MDVPGRAALRCSACGLARKLFKPIFTLGPRRVTPQRRDAHPIAHGSTPLDALFLVARKATGGQSPSIDGCFLVEVADERSLGRKSVAFTGRSAVQGRKGESQVSSPERSSEFVGDGRESRFWVDRPRLTDALVAALDAHVVLLRAPAGTGKSVALHHLRKHLRDVGRPVISLHHSRPSLPQSSSEVPIGSVVIVDSVRVDDTMSARLASVARDVVGTVVVVASRAVTALETPRFALRLDTVVVDAALLRLDGGQTAAVFAANGLSPSPTFAHALFPRLGGEAASVQLAATLARLQGWPVSTEADAAALYEAVLAERVDEVVTELDERTRAAAAALCQADAVSEDVAADALGIGAERAGEVLETIESAGVWRRTSMGRGHRFSASPLLRDVLTRTVRKDDSKHMAVCARLGSSMATHGDPVGGLRVAIAGADHDLAADIVDKYASTFVINEGEDVTRLLAAIPAEVKAQHPRVNAAEMLRRADTAGTAAAKARLDAVVSSLSEHLDGSNDPDGATLLSIGRRRTGQFGRALEDAVRARDEVDGVGADGSASQARAEALALLHMRRPHDARQRLLSAAKNEDPDAGPGAIGDVLALVDALEGRILAAEHALRGAADTPAAVLARALLALEEADLEQTMSLIDRHDLFTPFSEFWPVSAALRITLTLMQSDPTDALRVSRSFDASHAHLPRSPYFSGHLDAARSDLLVARRQSRSAIDLVTSPATSGDAVAAALARATVMIDRLHPAEEFADRRLAREVLTPRSTVELLLVKAVVAARLAQEEAAVEMLDRAEVISLDNGIRHPWRLIEPTDRERLSTLFADEHSLLSSGPAVFRLPLIAPVLSKREIVVLTRARYGGAIADMAADLNVSINTVKSQLRSAYRKLDTPNMRTALRAAHEWGILPPTRPGATRSATSAVSAGANGAAG